MTANHEPRGRKTAAPNPPRRAGGDTMGAMARRPNLHTAVRPVMERLDNTDPVKRIGMANDLTLQLQEIQAQIAASRRAAVRQLRADGYTLAKIAKANGITTSRVKQIEAGYSSRTSTNGHAEDTEA